MGPLNAGGPSPEVLQEVDLPLLSNAQCYLHNSLSPSKIGENMMCTFLPGKDSCQGDSGKMVLHLFMKQRLQHLKVFFFSYAGGPLIIPGETADNDIQVGVVSYGTGCADAWYPGVYAR